jgi:phosphate starvation-inducible membrane PsiE
MICSPCLSNVIEVLIFAMTRYIILDHSSMVSSLFGVLAIGILFAVRKFLVTQETVVE